MANIYSNAQTIAKPDRLVISISKNEGYDDVVLNTWPASSKKLNVSINSSINDEGFITIYDLNDKLIKQEWITIQHGNNNYAVDVNDISSDVYRIKVSGTSFNTNKRIDLE